MTPDYRSANAYQQLFADALRDIGVEVTFPDGYRRGLPLIRGLPTPAPEVLHLHWLNSHVRGKNIATRTAYIVKFLADLRLVKAKGVRLVWTVHNTATHDADFPALDRWLRRGVAQQADAMIVHDPSTRRTVADSYGVAEENVHVVPHGNYRPLYSTEANTSSHPSLLEDLPQTEGRVFLYFGMIRPYKGVDNLLSAWKRHEAQHPDDHLLIAGKPVNSDYAAHLQSAARDLKHCHLHLGFVDDEFVPAYFEAADVAVLPFRKITTSGSLVLAASFGVPVIAPRYESLAFALPTANDLLYAPSSSLAPLVDALDRASGIDLEALKERTRADCDRLDWSRIADLTYCTYTTNSV